MKIRKFAAILLVVILVLALTVPAFAEKGPATTSITINNPNSNITIDGKTFSAYRLFDLNYVNNPDPEADLYAYTVNNGFVAFFQRSDICNTDVTGGALNALAYNYVKDTLKTPSDRAEFADKAYDWATYGTPNRVAPIVSEEANGESVTLTVGAYGYYLVYTEASVLDSTDTVASYICNTSKDPNTEINIKADAPTVDKDVGINSTDYNETAVDADLGDTVYFKYTSKVPDLYKYSSYKFIFTDTLSEGLTFNSDSVKIEIGGKQLDNTDYIVAPPIDSNGGTLKVTISNLISYCETNGISKGADIFVTYTATINAAAAKTGKSDNSVYLTYSNDPRDENSTNDTPTSTVYVYNYTIPVYKYTDAGTSRKALANAEFALSLPGTPTTLLNFVKESGYYRLAITGDITTTTKLISDDHGNIDIRGLDAGTYILEEKIAPNGYNLLTDTITVGITAQTTAGQPNGKCTITSKYTNSGETAAAVTVTQIDVQNSTGMELPSTGGIGTTMFKLGGIMIILLAGVFLVINRKKVFGSGK